MDEKMKAAFGQWWSIQPSWQPGLEKDAAEAGIRWVLHYLRSQQESVAFVRYDDEGFISGIFTNDKEGRVPLYDYPIPSAPAVPEWQPIETAPKTGVKIIVTYLNRLGNKRTVMARWVTDDEAAESDHDGVGLEAGWYECIDNWDEYTEVTIHEGEPTHWMPLPAAPSPDKENPHD